MFLRLLRQLIDLVLYGNFWIAAGAYFTTTFTNHLLGNFVWWNESIGFATCSTLCLYAVHRIIGIQKLNDEFHTDRYTVILKFRHHIVVYAIIGGVGALYYGLQLSFSTLLYIAVPVLIGLAYVLPMPGSGKRLRDIDGIKVFLVAFVWAVITCAMPILEYVDFEIWTSDLSYSLLILERFLFLLAITLPFDIRDLEVDAFTGVETLSAKLGTAGVKIFAIVLTLCCFLLVYLLSLAGIYSWFHLLTLGIGYLLVLLIILFLKKDRPDYYFSGLLDGTLILLGGLGISAGGML